jgi:hypothetical protein
VLDRAYKWLPASVEAAAEDDRNDHEVVELAGDGDEVRHEIEGERGSSPRRRKSSNGARRTADPGSRPAHLDPRRKRRGKQVGRPRAPHFVPVREGYFLQIDAMSTSYTGW